MKKLIIIFLGILGLLVFGELLARYWLGLGDPPLSIADSEIDYLFAPNQKCSRFGNYIVYNDFSMRCDFLLQGTDPRQRVFVVGDSVINGGVLTDHNDLATTILQNKLDPSHNDTQVLNVSAGSWGPGNYAAYFDKYSELVRSNDVVIVEVNSHDLWEDDPLKTRGAMVGKDLSLPQKKPFCALADGVNRYFIPKIKRIIGIDNKNVKVDAPNWGRDVNSVSIEYNLKSLDRLYRLPWGKKYMLIYKSRSESMKDDESEGERIFREYAKGSGIIIIDCKLDGRVDYRDIIHPNSSGQRKLADAIAPILGCK